MKQGKYRILCTIDGTFCVQERVADGGWMEIYRCGHRNEEGLNEARKWIDERTEP